MIVSKGISIIKLLKWSGHHVLWLLAFMTAVAFLYHYGDPDLRHSLAALIRYWHGRSFLCWF
jgi:hypothetical protein